MKIHVELKTDERLALRRFMNEFGVSDADEAAHLLIREALIGSGFLELIPEIDEETTTVGEA